MNAHQTEYHAEAMRTAPTPKPAEAELDKMTKLEEAMQGMEGKQMPLLINGENWWPERHINARLEVALGEYEDGQDSESDIAALTRENRNLARMDARQHWYGGMQ